MGTVLLDLFFCLKTGSGDCLCFTLGFDINISNEQSQQSKQNCIE